MTKPKGSAKAFRSLNHNALQSLAFQIKRGGLCSGEAQRNMNEFDRRCREIVKLQPTGNLQNLQNLQKKDLWEIP